MHTKYVNAKVNCWPLQKKKKKKKKKKYSCDFGMIRNLEMLMRLN